MFLNPPYFDDYECGRARSFDFGLHSFRRIVALMNKSVIELPRQPPITLKKVSQASSRTKSVKLVEHSGACSYFSNFVLELSLKLTWNRFYSFSCGAICTVRTRN